MEGSVSQRVVIIGAGFAGLNAAKTLAKRDDVSVILIDQRNHHLFQPLLYQVATAGLNAADIAAPIRTQFADIPNVEVHLGHVGLIDLKKKTVQSFDEDQAIAYDFLIVACGAQHSYFAHPEWEEYAPGLKTLEQATEIRRRILLAFENAENEIDPEKQKAFLNFVIVGGGPTGVELAGAIADISRTVLVRDFKRIDPAQAKVFLVEAGPRVLAAFDPKLSDRTRRDLERLGVEVRTGARVENIDNRGVKIGESFIPSQSIFWAAGVQASPMRFEPAVERDAAGRVKVEPDLSLLTYPEVFVIGDMAHVKLGEKQIVPGLAPAAIQEGRHAAKMILADLRSNVRKPFRYVDKGIMATIGKNKAVLQAGPLKLGGRLAWMGWLFVHIFYLIGFKNRVSVLLYWIWSYVFSKRGARLITEKRWKLSE